MLILVLAAVAAFLSLGVAFWRHAQHHVRPLRQAVVKIARAWPTAT
jgi:hypothetical protein